MPNFVQQLALVSESKNVSMSEVTSVAAALDKQATRDLAPLWEIYASVHAFERLEDVPLGYWAMIVQDNIGYDAAGIHLDNDGQPFALITAEAGWSVTASHETLEMLVDPFGSRTIAGPSIDPKQGRVNYLVEVCDPSEAPEFGYTVNGVAVSDFYTRSYFDPVEAVGVRYSFTGAITRPREVLRGGYLSWQEPMSGRWFQARFFGAQLEIVQLPVFDASKGSLRIQIDALTARAKKEAQTAQAAPQPTAMLTAAHVPSADVSASQARAKALRNRVAEVVKNPATATLGDERAQRKPRSSERGRTGRARKAAARRH